MQGLDPKLSLLNEIGVERSWFQNQFDCEYPKSPLEIQNLIKGRKENFKICVCVFKWVVDHNKNI